MKKRFVILLYIGLFLLFLNIASARECYDLNLPSTSVGAILHTVQTDILFNTTLVNVPPGYDVANGSYRGYCFDWGTPSGGGIVPIFLYSSYNPPSYLAHPNWPYINYILNHKQSTFWRDIDLAIWHFINMGPRVTPNPTPKAQAMINNATAYGAGFVPSSGQVTAALIDPIANNGTVGGQPLQYTLIEVPCPYCGDNILNGDEDCELPDSEDNINCEQTPTEDCNGNKYGTRDQYGYCDADCGCVDDPFEYECVAGECGADCGNDNDCEYNSCQETYNDYCNGHILVDYNLDKILDNFTVIETCSNNCDLENCECSDCATDCSVTPDPSCVVGQCGAICATDEDCDDGDSNTIDSCLEGCTCNHEYVPYCGDGILDPGEECDDGNNIDGDGCSAECTSECIPPEIYIDSTARIWEPNDETEYTADVYGKRITNKHGVDGYVNAKRGNYVFTGETLKYFVIVQDVNASNINFTAIKIDGNYVGACAETNIFTDFSAFSPDFHGYDPETMKQYICKIVVSEEMKGFKKVEIVAITGICNSGAALISEILNFNPDYGVEVKGTVNFGAVTPGSVAASTDSIVLENKGDTVMDTYIAASDYFTDPNYPWAICGDGNGIPYYAFSYYAMKGSVNSGMNDNSEPGLGETENDPRINMDICTAAADEYTTIPSNSGRIDDMCRIINWDEDASLLNSGDTMSLLFQLDVPEPCDGGFTNGQFYFVGEVV